MGEARCLAPQLAQVGRKERSFSVCSKANLDLVPVYLAHLLEGSSQEPNSRDQ